MPDIKEAAVIGLIALVAVAVAMRVPAIRSQIFV